MKLIIFSGTSDGKSLCKWLSENGFNADVYVATQYGEDVMDNMAGISVHVGRLNSMQMENIFSSDVYVIDATHPYATEVTENIKSACENTKAKYIRLIRSLSEKDDDIICVDSTYKAVDFLSSANGNILLTTGSKELEVYTKIPDYQNRLFVRVLPSVDVVKKCYELGFSGSHIIAMQGPFSEEMNTALIKQHKCAFVVSKDTGKAGGFAEKQNAAKKAGAKMVMINRPTNESGYDIEQIKHMILNDSSNYPRFPLFVSLSGKKCLVVGGGNIAKRRIETLNMFGAEIKIIAKENKQNLPNAVIKPYSKDDLNDMFLAVAATDSREVNHQIYLDCKEKNIFVSVADCKAESTFFFPAICKNETLVCGLVSDGNNHHAVSNAAKKIRALLEEL